MHSLSDLNIQKPSTLDVKIDDMQRSRIKILRHLFRLVAPYFFGPKHQDIWGIGRFVAKVIGKATIDTRCKDGSWICFPLPVYTTYLLYGPDIKKYNVGNLTPVFRANVVPGTVAIDVGASCGQEVVELSKAVGEGGIVYAFEPSKSFAALVRTVNLNNLKNVVCVQAGCGNQNSHISEDKQQEYCIGEHTNYANSGTPIVRIDDFLELVGEKRPISLIKIDTDGFELEVVQGACNNIQASNAVVVAEFETQFMYSGHAPKSTLEKYTELGYSIEKIQLTSSPILTDEFDQYLKDREDKSNMIAHDIILRAPPHEKKTEN